MPNWVNYNSASSAKKASWDRMFEKLGIHEDRHVEIAIEEADRLAADLVGKDISKIAPMVTAANKRILKRQQALDRETNHGSKEGVQYGDVILEIVD